MHYLVIDGIKYGKFVVHSRSDVILIDCSQIATWAGHVTVLKYKHLPQVSPGLVHSNHYKQSSTNATLIILLASFR